jgi:threonine dehydrogenase-like Zn-dependent dehydrogenase
LKALVWTAPKVMEWKEINKPLPQADEVLIRVETVGICGSEIEGYLGHNSLRVPPLIMGHEFCGRIESWGDQVEGFTAEQKVVVNPLTFCGKCNACRKRMTQLCSSRNILGIHRSGAFGEWVTVPAKTIVPVPEDLDPFRAALSEPLACSLRATRRALKNHPFANVVIFGAGGIGLLCARVAHLLGSDHIIVVDTNGDRLQAALNMAADFALNPKESNLQQEISKFVGDKGVDAIIDAAGFQPTRSASMEIINPGGTFMNIGLGIDETELRINHLIRGEIEILGSFCYNAQDFYDAVSLLRNGRVTEQGWTEIRHISEGNSAFQDLINGRVTSGKILLKTDGVKA